MKKAICVCSVFFLISNAHCMDSIEKTLNSIKDAAKVTCAFAVEAMQSGSMFRGGAAGVGAFAFVAIGNEYDRLLEIVHDGKKKLQLLAINADPQTKHALNIAYKDACKDVPRVSSPDLFPGY